MAYKEFGATIAPANTSETGFPIAMLPHIAGSRVTADLETIQPWQLLGEGSTLALQKAAAIGQIWYVTAGTSPGHYVLKSWTDTDPTWERLDKDLATEDFVNDKIDNIPVPMIFKGTIGTGGTVLSLPTATTSTGFTYKVITEATYSSIPAKVGDLLISNGANWVLIPSGDDLVSVATDSTIGGIKSAGDLSVSITGVPTVKSVNIVGSLPAAEDNFPGRQVTYQGRSYIWDGSEWESNRNWLNVLIDSSTPYMYAKLFTISNPQQNIELNLRPHVYHSDNPSSVNYLLSFAHNRVVINKLSSHTGASYNLHVKKISTSVFEIYVGMHESVSYKSMLYADVTNVRNSIVSSVELFQTLDTSDTNVWTSLLRDEQYFTEFHSVKTNKLKVNGASISDETINFDTNNIVPDQSGTVTKTSTWLWQYLTQSINFLWLKLKDLFSEGSTTTNNNYLTKIDDVNKKLVKSNIYDNGTNVGIGTTSPNQQLEITKNFRLPATSGTTPYGIIYKDGTRFIHDFNYGLNGNGITTMGWNTFVGLNAGNFTMGQTAINANQASYNTGIGHQSLYLNTTGSYNTANGYYSLRSNLTGHSNTANGYHSLSSNTTGHNNTVLGYQSLTFNTIGSYNTALGTYSGSYLANGTTGRSTGNNGLYLGYYSKASADGIDNEIVIGANAIGKGSNTASYGNSSMTKHIFEAGKVGIGIENPSEKLDVNGNVKANGYKVGDGTNTKLLTDGGGTKLITEFATSAQGAKADSALQTSDDIKDALELEDYNNSNKQDLFISGLPTAPYSDFNDILYIGSYKVDGTYKNAPNRNCGTNTGNTANMRGSLNVFRSGFNDWEAIQQLFWDSEQYQRSYNETGWTIWKRLIKCDDFAGPGRDGIISEANFGELFRAPDIIQLWNTEDSEELGGGTYNLDTFSPIDVTIHNIIEVDGNKIINLNSGRVYRVTYDVFCKRVEGKGDVTIRIENADGELYSTTEFISDSDVRKRITFSVMLTNLDYTITPVIEVEQELVILIHQYTYIISVEEIKFPLYTPV